MSALETISLSMPSPFSLANRCMSFDVNASSLLEPDRVLLDALFDQGGVKTKPALLVVGDGKFDANFSELSVNGLAARDLSAGFGKSCLRELDTSSETLSLVRSNEIGNESGTTFCMGHSSAVSFSLEWRSVSDSAASEQ